MLTVKGAILTAGAIAGALGAIAAVGKLLPQHQATDIRIALVDVHPALVQLSQFDPPEERHTSIGQSRDSVRVRAASGTDQALSLRLAGLNFSAGPGDGPTEAPPSETSGPESTGPTAGLSPTHALSPSDGPSIGSPSTLPADPSQSASVTAPTETASPPSPSGSNSVLEPIRPARQVAPTYTPAPPLSTRYVRRVTDIVGQRWVLPPIPAGEDVGGGKGQLYALSAEFSLDPKGNRVPAKVAAERIVKALSQVRSIPMRGTSSGRGAIQTGGQTVKRSPLGVDVVIKIDLEHAVGKQVLLSWDLSDARSGALESLSSQWLRGTPAKVLEADQDPEATVAYLWVPAPKKVGDYILNISAWDGTNALTPQDSVQGNRHIR